MQTQLSAYYSRCVLKVSYVLESYTIPFILTSNLKQVRVGISTAEHFSDKINFLTIRNEKTDLIACILQ